MFYTIVGALFRTFPVLLSLGVIGRLCFTVQHTVTAIPSAYETWQNKAETLTPTLKKHEKTVGDHKNTYYCRLGYKCLIQVYSIDKRFYCRYLLRICLKKPKHSHLLCQPISKPTIQIRGTHRHNIHQGSLHFIHGISPTLQKETLSNLGLQCDVEILSR